MRFDFGDQVLAGVIARYLPTRARIVCDDEAEFDVPYPGLRAVSKATGRRGVTWLERTAARAEKLVAEHDLEGWSFQFDDASGRAGACNFDTQVIGLSLLYCLNSTDSELKETILHEIAHALAGPQHQHDRVWKEIARSIGCSGERLCSAPAFAPPRYIVSCPACGWALRRNVRRRGQVCAKCRGEFDGSGAIRSEPGKRLRRIPEFEGPVADSGFAAAGPIKVKQPDLNSVQLNAPPSPLPNLYAGGAPSSPTRRLRQLQADLLLHICHNCPKNLSTDSCASGAPVQTADLIRQNYSCDGGAARPPDLKRPTPSSGGYRTGQCHARALVVVARTQHKRWPAAGLLKSNRW